VEDHVIPLLVHMHYIVVTVIYYIVVIVHMWRSALESSCHTSTGEYMSLCHRLTDGQRDGDRDGN